MARPIGKNQQGVLDSLERHGPWSPTCGWVWSTYSDTVRILDSLIKRGLVVKTERPHYIDNGRTIIQYKLNKRRKENWA